MSNNMYKAIYFKKSVIFHFYPMLPNMKNKLSHTLCRTICHTESAKHNLTSSYFTLLYRVKYCMYLNCFHNIFQEYFFSKLCCTWNELQYFIDYTILHSNLILLRDITYFVAFYSTLYYSYKFYSNIRYCIMLYCI